MVSLFVYLLFLFAFFFPKWKKRITFAAMKQILKTLSVYIIAYLLLLMVVIGLLYAYPKVELHLWLNACHSAVLDVFFKYYSTFAEWLVYVLAVLPLFWKKKMMTFFFALSELSAAVFVQILKRLFSAPRPIVVFEDYPDLTLPLVQGVDLHHSNSFPSGHTSTFFVFFTCLAIILACHYLQRAQSNNLRSWMLFSGGMLMLLALAALGGYSRIYLSQHFMMDVCVGSIIGFVSPFLVFYFGRKKVFKLENV